MVQLWRLGLSPWMLVGVALILGLVLAGLSVRNNQRERGFMVYNLTDRAEALIWALEAGTRAGMRQNPASVQGLRFLLTETARQPGILYMAVSDGKGTILAQSADSSIAPTAQDGLQTVPEVEGLLLQPDDIPLSAEVTDRPLWRVREREGRKVFEVYRLFAPLNRSHTSHMNGRHGSGMMHMRGMGMWGMMGTPPSDTRGPQSEAPSRLKPHGGPGVPDETSRQVVGVALVGFDAAPFEAALAQDARKDILAATLAAAIGLAGFVSLFWARNYRRWRRILRDERAMAAEVMASLPLGIVTSDPEGHVTMINDTALGMFNRKRGDFLPLSVPDKLGDSQALSGASVAGAALRALPGLDWDALTAALAGGERLLEQEKTLSLVDAKPRSISLSAASMRNEDGVFLGNVFVLRDITVMKHLQAEAQRNDRLASLGHLAAGVAHEIRNPLSTIKGVALYIARRMPVGGREEEAARRMIDEVERLDRVVSELLEFARPGVFETVPVNLGDVVRRALRLAEADLQAKGITVAVDVAPDFPSVRVNPERITQALLNLFLNASQAMERGGRLRVSISNKPDGMFSIAVADNGPGIPPEIQASIFTPYFTTKPSGTGLGLAIVHQIAEGHGGHVSAGNTPEGHGAEFTLTLPIDGRT